jgi:hypothetical protein
VSDAWGDPTHVAWSNPQNHPSGAFAHPAPWTTPTTWGNPAKKKSGGAGSGSGAGAGSGNINPPVLNHRYVSLRGYGPGTMHQISVMCGDDPPTIKGGYAKWTTVDRPLRTGVTLFQGYDPVTMDVSLRFGTWTKAGWDTGLSKESTAGSDTEEAIGWLEWMAGAHFNAGASPFVYVNTYANAGGTTNLVPSGYQETVGVGASVSDTKRWPWVITGGITWGKSLRDKNGDRVYQECTFTCMNYLSFSQPPMTSAAGGYFTVKSGMDDVLLIAGAPSSHALDVQNLALQIKNDPKNNPIAGSKVKLSTKSTRWKIPAGLKVWVPAHTV